MEYADQMAPRVAALPLTLVVAAAAAGIAMALLFRLASRPAAIRAAKRRVEAQFLALRLFGDEPAVVWRALLGLLAANARYLGTLLVPMAAAAFPLVLAYPQLEALYARAALPVGSETVLTVQMERGAPSPVLEIPEGLKAVTQAVSVDGTGETSWELRVSGAVTAPVRIRVGRAVVTKSVQVGSGRGYLVETRAAGVLPWLRDPGEGRVEAPGVEWVRVAYGERRYSALGMEWGWEVWFLAIAGLITIAVKSFNPARFNPATFHGKRRRAAG